MKRLSTKLSFLWGLIMVLVVACNGDQPSATAVANLPEDVTFRPIDDIVEGELEVTNFVDGTAQLPVQTTVPVACSIVYGTTPEFGLLTLDQDMAGGAHSDHSPLLTNLESSTTYYYRLQGAGEDGIMYVSEVMTFTTPDFAASRDPVENLAAPERGAEIIGYSSIFGGGAVDGRWGVNNAFDGREVTEWSSDGDGNEAWVEVKLAAPARINAIEFQTRSMGDGSATTQSFTVTTDSGESFGPFALTDTAAAQRFDVDMMAETLRFDLSDTTGGNTGVVDIGVFGELEQAQGE